MLDVRVPNPPVKFAVVLHLLHHQSRRSSSSGTFQSNNNNKMSICLNICSHRVHPPPLSHATHYTDKTQPTIPTHAKRTQQLSIMLTAVASRCVARRFARKANGGGVLAGLRHATKKNTRPADMCASSSSCYSSAAFRRTPNARKSAVGVAEDMWEDEVNPPTAKAANENCIVNSHTEWDPLEEVIVGRVDGATIPEWHVSGKAVWPSKYWDMYKNEAGQPFPPELMQGGEREREAARGSGSQMHVVYMCARVNMCHFLQR